MEDTLRVAFCTLNQILDSLNPCFNGRYSQRESGQVNESINSVLILVLMEDTLRVQAKSLT